MRRASVAVERRDVRERAAQRRRARPPFKRRRPHRPDANRRSASPVPCGRRVHARAARRRCRTLPPPAAIAFWASTVVTGRDAELASSRRALGRRGARESRVSSCQNSTRSASAGEPQQQDPVLESDATVASPTLISPRSLTPVVGAVVAAVDEVRPGAADTTPLAAGPPCESAIAAGVGGPSTGTAPAPAAPCGGTAHRALVQPRPTRPSPIRAARTAARRVQRAVERGLRIGVRALHGRPRRRSGSGRKLDERVCGSRAMSEMLDLAEPERRASPTRRAA